jgi:hypothetical protein
LIQRRVARVYRAIGAAVHVLTDALELGGQGDHGVHARARQRTGRCQDPARDTVISTMWQTAQDMNVKYKETAEGGLALQIAVNVTEC